MALTTGDKVGLGAGIAVLGVVGYELWRNVSHAGKIAVWSAPQNKLVYGNSYKEAVNAAGGYDVAVTSGTYAGQHAFIYGGYPQGSNTFVPTGKALILGYYGTNNAGTQNGFVPISSIPQITG